MNCLPNTEFDCDFIKDTIIKIDKIQKEIQVDTVSRCVGCDVSLFTLTNNTIPVSFYTCNGNPILGRIGTTLTTTPFFRIESIRCNRYVTLRALTSTDDTLTPTEFTTIVDIECISQIQCYQPIDIELCTGE